MSSKKSTEIRGDRKAALLGTLAGWLMKAWAATLRVEIDDRCGITDPAFPKRPVIFVLWHNQIFCLPPIWWKTGGKSRKSVVLTSASKDGAVVAAALAVFGTSAVRGSSSRRGVAALIALKRALLDGSDACITTDGPRGPRYECQPGAIKIAQATGIPIVPLSLVCTAAWRLQTWDRLVIPKPFSRVRMIYDDMLVVPPVLDEAAFEAERLRVQDAMLRIADDV